MKLCKFIGHSWKYDVPPAKSLFNDNGTPILPGEYPAICSRCLTEATLTLSGEKRPATYQELKDTKGKEQ